MLLQLPRRDPTRILLVELNPYQILVAQLSRARSGEVMIESAAEFDRRDSAALSAWIEADQDRRKGRVTVLCSLVPSRGIVQRERVKPAHLVQPGYLEELIQEQQKGRFLTTTPFKVAPDPGWLFRTVLAIDGTPLPETGPARAALICAVASNDVLDTQERLRELRLAPERVEHGLLSLFGAVNTLIERKNDANAVAIVVVLENATAVYFIGKEGVHTPGPVLHGLNSILEAGRKELAVDDDQDVLAQLESQSPLALGQADKLVRRIGRDLKPALDSFELSTGQPVHEILCAYLPPKLSWLAEPLARSTGRQSFRVNGKEWLSSAGLQTAPEVPVLGPHWLGALNVVSDLPELFARKTKPATRGASVFEPPWHVDCRVPLEAETSEFAGRRLVTNVAVGAAAVLALAATGWQVYAYTSLQKATDEGGKRLEEHRELFKQLTTADSTLKQQTAVLDRAYELMAEPFQLSELLINLGRRIPARMRIERIESNHTRVAISGALLEPAEEASGTLGRYMEDLRREPGIGPLFSSIAITTLQRKAREDEVIFELTLRLKRPTP